MIDVIKLMLNSPANHSFYHQQSTTAPSDFIYDEVYKSASCKSKYSCNPKYIYYNALLSMKQKMRAQQSQVYNNVFTKQPSKYDKSSNFQNEAINRKTLMPIYHVQKINKMKFKVYKQGLAQIVQRMPVNEHNFQIKLKGDIEGQLQNHDKPRLEQILNEYRKMSINHRFSQSRGGAYIKRNSMSHSGDMNLRLMRSKVEKIDKYTSATTRRR